MSGDQVPFRDEAEFVRWLRRRWPERARGLSLGIGDDAAIVTPTRGTDLVLTTDLSIEGVHFRLDLHPARSVGHRALARALSDLAAMGARPRFALVSLSLPRTMRRSWINAFYDGLGALARSVGVTLIGGDTAMTGSAGVTCDVVAVGEARHNRALRRSRAQPGDCIYVTGRLGLSALGLALLTSGAGTPGDDAPLTGKLRARDRRAALRAHLYPVPRCRAGMTLARRGLAFAAIDVSDGFARDLGRLCDASRCGAVIWEQRLPLVDFGKDHDGLLSPLELGLHGGEDYELIFTVRSSRGSHVPHSIHGVSTHAIGEIRRGRGLTLIERGGAAIPTEPRGYDHFRRSEGA
jgi:thiamine-monophosphate kinase